MDVWSQPTDVVGPRTDVVGPPTDVVGPPKAGRGAMDKEAKRFKIITLGCKVNQFESACLRGVLLHAGWSEVLKEGCADVNIVNSCIVTQRASYQTRQAIRKVIKESPSATTAVIGCYAQVFPEELSGIEGVSLVIGNTMKSRVPEILLDAHTHAPPLAKNPSQACCPTTKFSSSQPSWEGELSDSLQSTTLSAEMFSGRTRGFLKIQDGCDSFCSYCIVPFARGHLRSLHPQAAISMLRSFADKGYKEVVLTGIHLGKYGTDLQSGMNLHELLKLIREEGLPLRIRLSSLEPKEIDSDLIDMVASEPWLCRHFHIPLQSGDDLILRRMNRKYTSREFAALIDRIKERVPLAAIGVDVMAGFPGEDERAFKNTFDLLTELPVSYLHVFPFSPRKGTTASTLSGRVNEKETKRRADSLRGVGAEKRQVFHTSCLGKTFQVLAEGRKSRERGIIRGFSDNYLPVSFPSTQLLRNEFVNVVIKKVEKNEVRGSVIPG
jgi:threonylcarbamoyladenosine tRNA methylthiotransferase MtaB